MAVLSAGAASCAVRVRNLSSQGALLEGSNLPAEKRDVWLKRGSLATEGQIAWSTGRQCGIRFSKPIVVAQWVERAGPVRQQRIDATLAEFRTSPATSFRLAGPSREADQHGLAEMSSALLGCCERLAALPGMSVQLAEELLKIEATARALRDLGSGSR